MPKYSRLRCAGGALIAAALSVAAAVSPAAAQTVEEVASYRLSSELARLALNRMLTEPLTMDSVEVATVLIQEAATLDPENIENWRAMLELGVMTENDELRAKGIEQVLRLDPLDERTRLMRLNMAIEKYQTADERIAAYERWLDPERIDQIGAPAASRLAMDLALLHKRLGNSREFADALSRSMSLDSSNRAAAALATGYFFANAKDPFAGAELLVNLLLADPADVPTQVTLAKQLLENGAYTGARRLYDLAVHCTKALGEMPESSLLVDQCIATWAVGDSEQALQLLKDRVIELDELVRIRARMDDRDLTAVKAMPLRAPVEPMLAAAITVVTSDIHKDQAGKTVDECVRAYRKWLELMKTTPEGPSDPQSLARINLEGAWMSVWMGAEPAAATEFLSAAEALEPLSPAARSRFDGWIAYRAGQIDEAVRLLAPLASEDPAAQLGLAMALLTKDQRKDAAVHLLGVARARPGSLIGVWAANRLTELLGQRVPISSNAAKLEELIRTIPETIDRYPTQPSLVLTMRITPVEKVANAYDPLLVDVEVTNNSNLPLAVDRDGPIRPLVLMSIVLTSANLPALRDTVPFVVDVVPRLRLDPMETVVTRVDLRRRGVGLILNGIARNGCMVAIRGIINYCAGPSGAIRPAVYGYEAMAPMIRVEGVETNEQWIDDSIALVSSAGFPHDAEDLTTFGLLMHKAGSIPKRDASEADKKQVEDATAAITAAFNRMGPIAQAWALFTMPLTENFDGILESARKSEHRLVRMAYLVGQANTGDPAIERAMNGDDLALQKLGGLVHRGLERAQAEADRAAAEAEAKRAAARARAAGLIYSDLPAGVKSGSTTQPAGPSAPAPGGSIGTPVTPPPSTRPSGG